MRKHTVRGYFRDQFQLNQAVQDLIDASFAPDLIRVAVATNEEREQGLQLMYRSGDLRGALIGSAAGAVLGALVAVLVVTDVIQARWLDAFLDVGIGSALFRGIVVGAAAVGLWGGIVGFGWWREEPPRDSEAKLYVLSVDTVGRTDEAEAILERYTARRR